MRQQPERIEHGRGKAGALQIREGIHIPVILDHVVQQRYARRCFVVHLRGEIKRVEHVGVAALVEIVPVRLKQDAARCFYELRVVHMPSLRMTNIGGVRRISIVAGASPLRNGTFAAYSKTPPDGGVLQLRVSL